MTPSNPAHRIETFFARANLLPVGRRRRKQLLYHYTTWGAAESILRSQRMWATAHDCTNDLAELASADEIIAEALTRYRDRSMGMARRLLDRFVAEYDKFRIGASDRTYLACFSELPDEARQWWCYATHGRGVCLGLRLFGLPDPRLPNIESQFMPVNYDPSDLQEKVNGWLNEFVGFLDRPDVADIEANWQLAFDTFRTTAAVWALTFKRPQWAPECEVRFIFLVHEEKTVTPQFRTRADGTVSRFLEVPLTRLAKAPVGEFLIGPNQDYDAGATRARNLLLEAGYRFDVLKPPRIIRSTHPTVAPHDCSVDPVSMTGSP